MLASLVHFINYKSGVRIITAAFFFLITQPDFSGCRFFRSLVLNIPFIFSTHYMSSAHLNRLINWLYRSHNEKSYYIFQILLAVKTRKKTCFTDLVFLSKFEYHFRFGWVSSCVVRNDMHANCFIVSFVSFELFYLNNMLWFMCSKFWDSLEESLDVILFACSNFLLFLIVNICCDSSKISIRQSLFFWYLI